MLSDGELRDGEQIRGSKSGVRGAVKDFTKGSKDIKDSYKLDNGRRRDFMNYCLLYTSPSPRDQRGSRMPSSA